ncbi:MAG: ATP-binding protein [Nitrospiria bacterium]
MLTLLVGTVPLLFGIGLAYLQGTRELQIVIGSSFAGLAAESSRKLDLVFSDQLAQARRLAGGRMIVEALQDSPADLVTAPTIGPLADHLRHALEADPSPAATRALFVTDARGRPTASITPDVSLDYAEDAAWKQAAASAAPYVGNVRFDERLGAYVFDLAVPILDARRRTLGVLHRVFDAKHYLDPLLSTSRFGKTGHVMLIDSDGTVISCPILPTGTRLTDPALIRLVTANQGGWARTSSDGHGSRTTSLVGFSPLEQTGRLTRASTGKGWHTFAWQSSEELFAPTRHLLTWVSLVGVVAIGLLGALGYVAAVRIVTPIRRLQEGAALIGRNELKEPISVHTGDEIEQLADEINRMNDRLQHAFSGLSQEVEEKTQEVRSLQEYNQKILDSVPNPILIVDDERVQYANHAAKQVFNVNGRTAPGTPLFEVIPLDETSREQLRSRLSEYRHDQPLPADARPRAPQGTDPSSRPYDPLSPRRVSDAREGRNEMVVIDRGVYRYELFPIGPPSTGSRWIGLVLRDTTGESRLQDELIQAEKLAGLGVLTSGLGHELNNPLFGILSSSEAIRDEKDADKMRDHAKKIVTHAKRMAGIIKDFSGTAQPDAADLRIELNVNDQLDQALSVVGLMNVVAGLKVQRHYQPLPKMRALPEEIGQVFIHVITNAIQAMKGKGTIDLTTEVSRGLITVKIRDGGPGIPKAYLPKIFDPFFTTKAPGQGTGLGLTISRRIVLKYGGQIHVQTKEGEGTTFIMTFPGVTPPE